MAFDLQPINLKKGNFSLEPLQKKDFDNLFAIASDPLIWEQHPSKNRYQEEIFKVFFNDAMDSNGAFKILDTKTNSIIGSSRFYECNELKKTVAIGYTFFSRSYWGTECNKVVKLLMLNHAFEYIDTVFFHVGASNIRSQKAVEKLGALKISEIEMEYVGEPNRHNYIYQLDKSNWQQTNN